MSLRTSLFSAAAVALAATFATPAHAQDPVRWTVTPVSKTAKAGGQAAVKITATIDEGWHLYSITQGPGGPTPTRITVPAGQPFTLGGQIKAAPPDVKFDPNFGIEVESYEEGADFTVPVKVDKAAKGTQNVQVAVRYQVCNASTCIPPRTDKLTAPIKITTSGK